MSDHVLMKDIDGKTVVLKTSDLTDYFLSHLLTIYGMNLDTIEALRHEYIARGGSINMTPDTVREIFRKTYERP